MYSQAHTRKYKNILYEFLLNYKYDIYACYLECISHCYERRLFLHSFQNKIVYTINTNTYKNVTKKIKNMQLHDHKIIHCYNGNKYKFHYNFELKR